MEIKFNGVHTAKDLTISAIVLAAGIGLFFVSPVAGVALGVCGLLMFLLYKTAYKRDGEDLPLKKKAMDVAQSSRQSLKGFLDGEDVDPELNTTLSGGVVRLEAYYNREASVAYAQLFDFAGYNYEPATEVIELRGDRADKLISKLSNK